MKCPFRIDVEYEYVALKSAKEGEEDQYLEKAQRQKFPECAGSSCPFYVYGGGCERANLLTQD